MVEKAVSTQIEQIVLLDESVIGSRSREVKISEAVEQGRCQVIELEHMMGLGFEFITDSKRTCYMKKDGSNPEVSAVMVYYQGSGTSLVLLSNTQCNVWDMHRKVDEQFGLSKRL